MEHKQFTENPHEQEIDLWAILQKTSKWCVNILRIVIVFLVQKSIWLLTFAVVGALLGCTLYKISKPYYNSTMQLYSNVLSNDYFVDAINNEFSHIIKPKDFAKKLAVPDSIAKQIRSIEACYGIDLNKDGRVDIIDEKNKYIHHRDSSRAARIVYGVFYVNVHAYSVNEDILSTIRNNVMQFISTNEYVQLHNQEKIVSLQEQTKYIESQISRLDSLQQADYFKAEKDLKKSAGQLLILNEKDHQLYHGDLLGLDDRILNIHTTLALYSDPVTITQEFSETDRRKNNLVYYVRPSGIIFLLLGFVFVLIWDNRKTLRKLFASK
jgi:hypothetical protein